MNDDCSPATLIDNALDFIHRAATELDDETLSEHQRAKYSTVHLYEGIELLLKARLVREHWSLIIKDMNKYQKGDWEDGKFVSVSYDQCRERLDSFCGVDITAAHNAFDGLRNLRNRYVHFRCMEEPVSVLGLQLQAWHHALGFVEQGQLGPVSQEQGQVIERVKGLMLRKNEFLDARLAECTKELQKERSGGRPVLECPDCRRQALLVGDVGAGYPKCLVCGTSNAGDMDTERLAESYVASQNAGWGHHRHGPDDELGSCAECYWRPPAVVPLHGRMTAKTWVCFHCGRVYARTDMEECCLCGQLFFGNPLNCPACEQPNPNFDREVEA